MATAEDEPRIIQPGTRERFNAALKDFAEAHPHVAVPELARMFVEHLTETDVDLALQILALDAQSLIAELRRRQISVTRNRAFTGLDLQLQNRPNARKAPRSDTLFERIEAWQEYVPVLGRHENIMAMNRAQLQSSADYDAQRMDRYALKMLVKRELAGALQNDKQVVADIFTTEQVRETMESVRIRLSNGSLRLHFRPSDTISLTDTHRRDK